MAKERPPVEEMTLRQLRKVAAEFEIFRYSRMRKSQLLEAIQVAQSKGSFNRLNRNLDKNMTDAKEIVEATKFDLGEQEISPTDLTTIQERTIPDGYGESRIVLLPRDPQWAYVYWDIPNSEKEQKRLQGGQQLALRLYDSTNLNLDYQYPHSIQEYPCDELAREWYLPVPVSDRSYVVEIGYRCADGRWLVLSRSVPVNIPPVYPTDWIEDHFITVPWEQNLVGETLFNLITPEQKSFTQESPTQEPAPIYDQIFNLAQSAEEQRIAGSLYGSQQQSGAGLGFESLSSYVFPSGVGLWSGAGISGLTASGVGMSGAALLGVGVRPRQFWLVADAELIVYGATEPDATVTIGGRPIKLNDDGTFRHHMSFQDGIIDYPIFALAADGEQNRSIHLKFERQTLERRTNTKEEAVPEWLV
ncbi:hypothetical protein Syn7502_01220 [Synechococcus sp. PCC 7502]|uniref:DUF4912 domain-containing protein n=1 Tax=Synechococcus sp. PCC 7502 TaxID=1173263 RepID=UPI00029FF8AA|nr:DUF4912 domain-containing protein [Synechococcus sp. PCC 7502]AFY73323.1 hypothetical protein Syn7502_01220 [Synechococcus sp. PCC 7502]